MPERGVANRLYDLLIQRFGVAPAVMLTAWDGSRAATSVDASADASAAASADVSPDVVVHLTSRKAVRRLLWTPGALGVARAYVTGQLDVVGDFAKAVHLLLDYADLTADSRPMDSVDRREVLRIAVLTGAVGPVARTPDVSLDALEGYAPVGREIVSRLRSDLARAVLGAESTRMLRNDSADGPDENTRDPRSTDGAGDDSVLVEQHVTFPEPLSALVRRWEDEGVEVVEIRRVSDHYGDILCTWSRGLEREWDAVRDAAGEQRARVWRLSLALNRENLQRGRVTAYQVRGQRPPR